MTAMLSRLAPLLPLLALLSCGEEPEPDFEVEIVGLPEDGVLRIPGARPGSSMQWLLRLRSRVDRSTTLRARLVPPVREGLVLSLRGTTSVLPQGRESARLVLRMPTGFGPLEGVIELSCPELDWTREVPYRGEVDDVPLEGVYLVAEPRGVDLGTVKPGEALRSVVVLRAIGSQPVTIREWAVDDREHVKLLNVRGGETIQPGGELQVNIGVLAPDSARSFRHRVRVYSDARNVPKGLDIMVSGRVAPDYAPRPAQLQAGTVYPMHERTHRVLISAAKGRAPFRVESVEGHERHFEVVSKGSEEPAPVQEVVLKVRRDAPTDMERPQRFSIRFDLGPDIGEDVVVPVAMRFVPPIHAKPARVRFGVVDPEKDELTREVRLVAFANRRFEVTNVRLRDGDFQARKRSGGAGIPWSFTVAPVHTDPGLLADVLIIETDDEQVPEIAVPISAEIR